MRARYGRIDVLKNELEDVEGIEVAYLSTVRDVANQLRDSGPRTKLRVARELLGMSQIEFAKYFRIPLATLRNWEAESRPQPSGTAELFIDLLSTNPEAIRELAQRSGRSSPEQPNESKEETLRIKEVA